MFRCLPDMRGFRARVCLLALLSLAGVVLWLNRPEPAVARSTQASEAAASWRTHRPEISFPVRTRVSGRMLFLARGLGRHVRRVVFMLDGHRLWVRVGRPFGDGGWIDVRGLRSGWHRLSVVIVYRYHVRVLRREIYVLPRRAHRSRAKSRSARGHNSNPGSPSVSPPPGTTPPPVTTPPPSMGPTPAQLMAESWTPAGSSGRFTPLPDSVAAAQVTPAPETRPGNTSANQYVPTAAQIQAFRSAIDPWGRTPVQANPYNAYVTGDFTGTTDEIIQWAAAKWGLPVDWLRAEYTWESHLCDSALGDLTTVSPTVYNEYPPQARVPGTHEVYESMGISQVKWIPDGSIGNGTEPLRWESTAFNADYQAAMVRFFYDDPNGLWTRNGDPGYQSGQQWNSIGGWYNPWPWANGGQIAYVQDVQSFLVHQQWKQPYTCS